MKKNIMAMALAGCALSVSAQDINIPAPDFSQKSMTVMEALKTRHSVRQFDASKELSNQQISDLCWAALGMSRDDNHRTAHQRQ